MSVVSKKVLSEYDELKPFNWCIPHNIPSKAVIYPDFQDINHINYRLAIHIDPQTCNPKLYSRLPEEKLLKMAALPAMTSYPVVNHFVLSLLNELCPNDFQTIPIEIKSNPEERKLVPYCNKDYYLINILNFAETIDFERSELDFFDNNPDSKRIRSIELLVFKQNCMNGHHLARDRHSKSLIAASRELALLLNQHKVIGVELRPDYAAYEYYTRTDRGAP